MLAYYETDRLILMVLTPDHSNLVLNFYSANRSVFEPYDPACPENYFTEDYQRASLCYEYNSFLNRKSVRYYVFKKEAAFDIIGTISFTNIQYGFFQSATTGYKFSQMHQHQGYASESLKKGIEVMFAEEGLHRLEAFVIPSNTSSKRLLQRLGFSYEGIALEYALVQNQWTDHEQYSLLSHNISLHQYPN